MNEYLSIWKGMVGRPIADLRTMTEILADVAAYYELDFDDLKGPAKERTLSVPRQEAMAAMHATGRYSLAQIGRFLAGRDHSTIAKGIDAHNLRIRAIHPQPVKSRVDDRICHSAPLIREAVESAS